MGSPPGTGSCARTAEVGVRVGVRVWVRGTNTVVWALQRVLCVAGRLAARDGAPNAVWVVNCVVALRLAESLGGEVLSALAIDKVVSALVAAAAARADVMVAAAMPVRGILHARRVRRGVLPSRRVAWATRRA